jgi:hypothetical protein
MRELSATIPVRAPSDFAVAFLNTYVEDLAAAGGGDAVLPLRFTVERLAGLVLEREVTVHVTYQPRPGEPAILLVSWQPAETTIFPRFDGTVQAQPDGDRACKLTIEGMYDVPLGVVGVFFDAVVGVHIARSTLDGLLREFRDAIERDYDRRTGFER